MGHGHKFEDIGPPASFDQLPQPEGDWNQANAKKQSKYNMVLGASVLFFGATMAFVSKNERNSFISFGQSIRYNQQLTHFVIISLQMLKSEILFFNAFPPDTYE